MRTVAAGCLGRAWHRRARGLRGRGPSHTRGIFDSQAYYDQVFGELSPGEAMEWYNCDLPPLEAALAPLLLSPFSGRERPARSRVLDLGCGASVVPAQLAASRWWREELGLRLVVGVDSSPRAIDAQRATWAAGPRRTAPGAPAVRFVRADGAGPEGLPLRDQCFHVVLEKGCVDALCSTPQGGRRVAPLLREAWRVVAPGGWLVSIHHVPQSQSSQGRRLSLLSGLDLVPAPTSLQMREVPSHGLQCYALQRPEKGTP